MGHLATASKTLSNHEGLGFQEDFLSEASKAGHRTSSPAHTMWPQPPRLPSVPHTHATAHHRAFARVIASAWSTLSAPSPGALFLLLPTSIMPTHPSFLLPLPHPHALGTMHLPPSVMNDSVHSIEGVFG